MGRDGNHEPYGPTITNTWSWSFATKTLGENCIVLANNVLVFDANDLHHLLKTVTLKSYFWNWDSQYCMVLGIGSLLNHSKESNVKCVCVFGLNTMQFVTLRKIESGEELLIDYAEC